MRPPSPTGPGGRAALGVAALVMSVLVAGCGIGAGASPASFAPPSVGPSARVTAATGQTRGAIAAALATVASGIQFGDATRPYRPPESGRLRDAPRAAFQVVLPDEPDGGYIVVYEFPDSGAAVDAGNEEAGYLGTGPARVNVPRDAQHVLRQLGPTLILFTWSPSDPDATAEGQVAAALNGLGVGFTVPN